MSPWFKLGSSSTNRWALEGWDTFAGESYPIPGSFSSEQKALRAGKVELRKIEKQQPSETSGGQDGIQDKVYIVAPDGKRTRILPD